MTIDGYSPQTIVVAMSIDVSHPQSTYISPTMAINSKTNYYGRLCLSIVTILEYIVTDNAHRLSRLTTYVVVTDTRVQRASRSAARYILCYNSSIILRRQE